MKINLISKLVTLKLITLLLVCPFITYGMKRKRDETAPPLPSSSIASTSYLNTPAQDDTSSVTPTKVIYKLPKKLANTLNVLSMQLGQYSCKYKNCTCKQVYKTWKGLRTHIIAKHAPQLKCAQCKKNFWGSALDKAKKGVDKCSNGAEHQIEQYPWTPERHQEFLNGLSGFNINPQKRQRTNKQKINSKPPELLSILSAVSIAIEKNNRPFICLYKNCTHKQVYKTWKGLKIHIIAYHAPQFQCKLCKKNFQTATLGEAKKRIGQCSNGVEHQVESYPWTLERQQEFLNGLSDFNIDPQDMQNITRQDDPYNCNYFVAIDSQLPQSQNPSEPPTLQQPLIEQVMPQEHPIIQQPQSTSHSTTQLNSYFQSSPPLVHNTQNISFNEATELLLGASEQIIADEEIDLLLNSNFL